MSKRITTTIITTVYPDPYFIERGAFVEQMVREWGEMEMKVNVVAPRSWANRLRGGWKARRKISEIAGSQVSYPSYFSLSNKKIAGVDLEKVTRNRFMKSVASELMKQTVPDLFYGKFLMRGGAAALMAGKTFNRPAVADIGENFVELSQYSHHEKTNVISQLDGIVTVSQELADEMARLGINPEKILVAHNSVNTERFYPMNRLECRRKLSLPEDLPLVIFVGYFTENKGPRRVVEAVSLLGDLGVKALFAGRGHQQPGGEDVLHAAPVRPDELPYWLNAADLFVLPTLFEGDCNAIHEAMACGLPIVSSDIPEVRSQVPEHCGILTDPNSSDQLADAIRTLLTDDLKRSEMGKGAAQLEEERSRISRSKKISDWISHSILENR